MRGMVDMVVKIGRSKSQVSHLTFYTQLRPLIISFKHEL